MKSNYLVLLTLASIFQISWSLSGSTDTIQISRTQLLDKIKGGWAGQVIGCTYGGPTEFRFNGTMIQNYVPIEWNEDLIEWWFKNSPGLYDDIYMDLTFVEVMEKEGIDAPAFSHAKAFANADYPLWHANQAARYNILNGIMPPDSGHWLNNPHADDIDFQIEADFAGLMSPGMPNAASEICDRIGHIMNYGDGWYGGVYVAAMYSLAFINEDIETIVKEALKTIPSESDFHKCITDVIKWHEQYPEDWKCTWFECQKKWSSDIGCPDGVFSAFNIDAKINAAYVVIGLLYGEGDFGKTTDISTRCGQDSDCNPATAAGILGTVLGYNNIPAYWKQGLSRVEDLNFQYTELSLNKVYALSLKHALMLVEKHGGSASSDTVSIKIQSPKTVKLEKAFEGTWPVKEIRPENRKAWVLRAGNPEINFDFEGTGFIISGRVKDPDKNRIAMAEVYIDGQLHEVARLPANSRIRRHEISWCYHLPRDPHSITVRLLEPGETAIDIWKVLVYDGKPPVTD